MGLAARNESYNAVVIGDEIGSFTKTQLNIIVAFERAGAALSVTGVLTIFVFFACYKRLRTVPNTFIVFASFANLCASIACLIGYDGIHRGQASALCQAQAFMFELFMQSDPWWSFAMAVNVYMVFFFAANPKNFLSYWWAYFIVCYGIPFIPSLWLLLVHGANRGAVYGDATIWCWIGKDWSNLRIYTYYLPIWVCILLSTCIYASVGYYVFKQRNQLRNLSLSNPAREPRERDSAERKLFPNAATMGSIATEVTRTTTVHQNTSTAVKPSGPVNWFDRVDDASHREPGGPAPAPNTYRTVTRITADPAPKESAWARFRTGYRRWCNKFSNMDPIKLAYLRTSFVFAISVLVTWTPSSVNRVHDLVHKGSASFGLNLASSIVLPLQGVWNAVIFFSTSSTALKQAVRATRDRWKGLPRGHHTAAAVRNERERTFELERRLGGLGRKAKEDMDASSVVTGSTMRVIRDGSLASL